MSVQDPPSTSEVSRDDSGTAPTAVISPDADGGGLRAGALSYGCWVVVPVYNPGPRFTTVVATIASEFAAAGIPASIVVVDDCSAETILVPAGIDNVAVIRHEENRGKGAALRTGMLYALETGSGQDTVGFIDGDGDIDPAQLVRYTQTLHDERLAGFDTVAVVGSKWLNGSHATVSRFRAVQSKVFAAYARALMPVGVSDTQAGIKVFHGPWLRAALPLTRHERFLLDVELLAIASGGTTRSVVERPVALASGAETSTISLSTSISMACGLLAMSVRTRRGRRLQAALNTHGGWSRHSGEGSAADCS